MNHILEKYARDYLKENLQKLDESNNIMFKRMYSHDNLDLSISEVIDNMNADYLDWAMIQVENTFKKAK